jgi:hypothetical protein
MTVDNHITVPDGLSEDDAAEFIRSCIRERGGDPETAYLISADDPNSIPFDGTVSVTFGYD